jgi:hypothetical protein
LNRVCSNAVVTLNGNSKGLPIRDFQAALNWYQNQSWFDTATLACCPSCPDGINNLQGSGRPPAVNTPSGPQFGNSQFWHNGSVVGTVTDGCQRWGRGSFAPDSAVTCGSRCYNFPVENHRAFDSSIPGRILGTWLPCPDFNSPG